MRKLVKFFCALLCFVVLAGAAGYTVLAWGEMTETKTSLAVIQQNPELPQGCEVTSLAMLLNHAGYDVDKMELVERYLPMNGAIGTASPYEQYVGDPRNVGWYCFSQPIVEAANQYLGERGEGHRAVDVTGIGQRELERTIKNGTPVAVWVTLGFEVPETSATASWTVDGESYTPYSNLHCVVAYGYNYKYIYIADPLGTFAQVPKADFMRAFEAMGSYAIVIE